MRPAADLLARNASHGSPLLPRCTTNNPASHGKIKKSKLSKKKTTAFGKPNCLHCWGSIFTSCFQDMYADTTLYNACTTSSLKSGIKVSNEKDSPTFLTPNWEKPKDYLHAAILETLISNCHARQQPPLIYLCFRHDPSPSPCPLNWGSPEGHSAKR